ncbi:MAG: hypothetical protein HY318_20710 [Armatimonadetes bacterium]|nr:hypothetical protein [Armatimonadota bacterium]
MSSQRPGNELQGDEIPRVRYFQSAPEVQFTEVWGDRIYPQMTRYRRAVLLVEDVIVDIFDVVGGQVHDWLYHGDGYTLDFDLPVQPVERFEPAAYLMGGDPRCEKAVAAEAWSATWELGPEKTRTGQPLHLGPVKWTPHDTGDFYPERKQTVFHRLTMLPSPGTEIYHLRTYPVQKKPTGNEGFTHTVLARRRNNATPFVSLFDTYLKQPRVRQRELLPAKPEGSVALSFATDTSRTVVMYNPEPERRMELVDDGKRVEMHGHFAVVCFTADGKPKNVLLCGVSRLQLPGLALELEAPANLSLTLRANGRWTATARADLEYESLDGKPVCASAGDVDLWLRTPTSNQKIRARGRR